MAFFRRNTEMHFLFGCSQYAKYMRSEPMEPGLRRAQGLCWYRFNAVAKSQTAGGNHHIEGMQPDGRFEL